MVTSKQSSNRRARVDSKESAVVAMAHANRRIAPPNDMVDDFDEVDEIIFDEIISEFANVDWSKHSIRLAALLTRTIRDMMEDQKELRDEGSVIQNDKGNYAVNPRRTACQGYASMIMQMRRSLALHATAGAKKGDVGNRRNINKNNEADAPDDDDDMIPFPKTG